MAVTLPKTQYLTYQDYLAEPEIMQRYDILDGVRYLHTNPSRYHQRLLCNVFEVLRDYERLNRNGETLIEPCDILIRISPLHIRQADVMFMSHERLAQCKDENDPTPLLVAPELVVEIVSTGEMRQRIADKIADYASMDAKECWLVDTETKTVEILSLTKEVSQTIGIYTLTDTFESQALPNLSVRVDEIFASM